MRTSRFLTSQSMRFTLSRQKSDSQREINLHQPIHVTAALKKKTRKAELTRQEKCLTFVLHCHYGIRSQLRKTLFPTYILNFKTQNTFIYADMRDKATMNGSNIFTSKRIKFQNFHIRLFPFSFHGVSSQGSFYVLRCFERKEFLILNQV